MIVYFFYFILFIHLYRVLTVYEFIILLFIIISHRVPINLVECIMFRYMPKVSVNITIFMNNTMVMVQGMDINKKKKN